MNSIGNDIEPSLCALISRKSTSSTPIVIIDEGLVIPDFSSYLKYFQDLICSNKRRRILCYGAGHNLDRFIQILQVHEEIDLIYDSSVQKIGKYLIKIKTPITCISHINLSPSDLIILGVHDRNIRSAKQHISSHLDFVPTFLSIYETPI